jgi:peptidoglycan hydrolase-like protein with peptidoglycan-binding domain
MGYTRDLGSQELWQYSTDRSHRRRAAARNRRRIRRMSMPLVVAAATAAAPTTALAGSGGGRTLRGHARVHPLPTLRLGSTGPDVVTAQRLLGVTADGVFGPETLRAVRRFQARHGLAVDGLVGPRTWAGLRAREVTRSTPAVSTGSLVLGDRGPAVARVQRLLGVAADGDFGPVTLAAVKRFQRQAGLVVDGQVGPLTEAALQRQDVGRVGQISIVLGDRGPAVARVQRLLGVAADGDFGPQTLAAVKRFQRLHGLVVDGQVGPFTMAALLHGRPVAVAAVSPTRHLHHRRRRRSTPPVVSTTSFGERVVELARRELGVRYTWGGNTPAEGFDCSGLVEYVFGELGVGLPHYAASQYRYGTHVSRDDLEPGDLVFFNDLGHVAIYVGGGQVIAAPHTGTVVQIQPLAWAGSYVGATRIR